MNRGISIAIILVIIGLILFDSAQQKYYLETFDLNAGNQVSYILLLKTHLIRWVFWAMITLPISIFAWRQYFKTSELSSKNWLLISLLYFCGTVISLVCLSIHSMVEQTASYTEFGEFFEFFAYQKGLSFLLASLMVILLLFNRTKSERINDQIVEIKNLRKTKADLEQVLSERDTPHLQIKVGYKLIPVALEDISWIQSDDYCVKIHTSDKTYTLRQSLKTLEEKLSPYRFIRIHRSALLNLDYIDQINFDTAKVTLRNKTEVPYSKSGIRSLKDRMPDLTS